MHVRVLAALVAALGLLASGCGGDDDSGDAGGGNAENGLSGRIQADGSSTVGPFTTAAAERFGNEHGDVRVTVGISGTGGGFERFCRGETDISNASRPIKDEEAELCERNGVDFAELHVVNDGLAVVVNPENDWVECLTLEQLNAIWKPGSKLGNWREVPDASFPDVPLRLAGAGTDSGTFDYFTEAVNGESGASRSDYTASEDDNVTVQAVSGEPGGLGYFGLSYVEENEGRVKPVAIENEAGECVQPSTETVQDGSYNPLGRPLFVYTNAEALQREEVRAFVEYLLDNNGEIAEAALFVPLTDEQLQTARDGFEGAAGGEDGDS